MIESKYSTFPVAPITGSQSTNRSVRSPGQRSNLAICIVPLLLLGATCAGAAIQRSFSNHDGRIVFGHMSREDAYDVSNAFFMRLNGTPPTITETSTQSAYSVRRRAIVREWSVLCSTPSGDYLLRINADSRRVYAINRMDDGAGMVGTDNNILSYGNIGSQVLSHNEAETRARDYAGLIGIAPQSLSLVADHIHDDEQSSFDANEPEWNFTFRRMSSGSVPHLVTVSICSKDGRLEHLWNPVFSL